MVWHSELFQSVPYGKRAILVAKQKNVDELFNAVSYLIDPTVVR